MPTNLSRRELLAWLAAGAGAAATGSALLFDGSQRATPSSLPQPSGTTMRPQPTTTAGVPRPTTPAMEAAAPVVDGDRMLVVVEMAGGNDGLSMVVPHQNGAYYDARPETAIAQGDVLDLDGQIGLHPNLTQLHRRGVTVVQGVGSVEPSGSHFEMQQRWWAGNSLEDGDRATGWLGRLADVLAPEDGVMRAVSITSGNHPIVRSARNSTMTIPGLDAIQLLSGAPEGDEMRRAYQTALRGFTDGASSTDPTAPLVERNRGLLGSTIDFAARLVDTGDSGDVEAAGYSWSGFQQGLWLAASILGGDTGIRVIHVNLDGDFDTHEGHAWRHPELMTELDTGLAAFRDDLERRGLADRVMVVTASEFGRTIEENGNAGLDHGSSSSALVLRPGDDEILGEAPSLTRLDDNGDQFAAMPFESYLAGAVEGWLGVPANEVFESPSDVLTLA